MTTPRSSRYLLTLGDSIAAGLGTQGASYPNLLHAFLAKADDNPWHLIDYSASARMLSESYSLVGSELAHSADLTIIHHGITEAIIRPSGKALRWLPRRWRKPGWTDPRPYFSRRRIRHAVQRIESEIRWRTKVAIIKAGMFTRYQSPDEYAADLSSLLSLLLPSQAERVIILSHCGISERYSPFSAESLGAFHAATLQVVERHPRRNQVAFVDVQDIHSRRELMLLDGFHPSAEGHRVIAHRLFSTYRQLVECQDRIPSLTDPTE